MNDIERNKAVVREFDELGNQGGDLSQLPRLCTPDIVNHALADGRIAKRWAIRDDLGTLVQLGALRRAEDHT